MDEFEASLGDEGSEFDYFLGGECGNPGGARGSVGGSFGAPRGGRGGGGGSSGGLGGGSEARLAALMRPRMPLAMISTTFTSLLATPMTALFE